MLKAFEPYLLTFIPIFVAVDAIGNIPLFIGMVESASKKHREKIIVDSVTTATVMAVVFMLVGKWVLRLLNITISDFQIAGGGLLFVISVRLLLPGSHKMLLVDKRNDDVGVFPLGTPLITGPAVLATTLILLDAYGIIPTLVALLLNMFITWLTLVRADLVMKILGVSGTRAVSKIMYILLAAIAVMMIRRGIYGAFLSM